MKNLYLFILALIVCVGTLVAGFAFMNHDSLNEYHDRRFWFNKMNAEASDLLILGDSRMYRGFDSGRGLNFAFSSNSYTKDYLEFALSKVKENGTVILGITPQSLTDYNLDDHFRLMRDQSRNVFSESLHLLETLIPRSNLFTFMSGEKLPWKYYPQDARVIYHTNGWMETLMNRPTSSMGKESYAEAFKSHAFNPQYTENISNFILEVRKLKHARVYLVYPPTSQEVYELENTFAVSKMNVFEEIRKLEASTGATFVDVPQYHVMDTFDGDHLDSEHARRYTKAVMDSISQRP